MMICLLEKKKKAYGRIISIHVCAQHSRLAITRCQFEGQEYIYLNPNYDLCHSAHLCDLKKHPRLILASHLLCMKDFEVQLNEI